MHTHTSYLVQDYLLLPLRICLYYLPNLSLSFLINLNSSEAFWFVCLACSLLQLQPCQALIQDWLVQDWPGVWEKASQRLVEHLQEVF